MAAREAAQTAALVAAEAENKHAVAERAQQRALVHQAEVRESAGRGSGSAGEGTGDQAAAEEHAALVAALWVEQAKVCCIHLLALSRCS